MHTIMKNGQAAQKVCKLAESRILVDLDHIESQLFPRLPVILHHIYLSIFMKITGLNVIYVWWKYQAQNISATVNPHLVGT